MRKRIVISLFIGVIIMSVINWQAGSMPQSFRSVLGFVFGTLMYGFVAFVISLFFGRSKAKKDKSKEADKIVENGGSVYAKEDAGIKLHNEGAHCDGCPDSEIQLADCKEEPHCPACPQAEIHLS